MAKVLMYSTGVCPYCIQAERLLKAKGVADIDKIRVDLQPEQRDLMIEKTGRQIVKHHRFVASERQGLASMAAYIASATGN